MADKQNNRRTYDIVKRIFDVVVSILALLLLSPVFLIIAVIIKCDSKGPVFYKHHRIGKNGKPFGMYKFRSMVNNSQEAFEKLPEEMKQEFYNNYKIENDPRITKVGNILRKTSLDELPQFVNVIKGDLSLVGPRPIIEKELEKYGEDKDKFLSVIPGITGYWQSHGRSNVMSYDERKQMELHYIDNASLLLDLKILFKTVLVVFKREGAK